MSHHFPVGFICSDLVGVNTRGDWNVSAPDTAISFWFSALLLFNVISHCLSQFICTRSRLVIRVMSSLLMGLQYGFYCFKPAIKSTPDLICLCPLGDNTEQMVEENRRDQNWMIDWKATGKELFIKRLLRK